MDKMSAMPGNECCCQAVSDYFRQLFCVTQVLQLLSSWIPCMEDSDSPERGRSSVSTWENNNGPTRVKECSRVMACDKCDRTNLRGPQTKPRREFPEEGASDYGSLQSTAGGTSSAVVTDQPSTTALERCGHFLNLRNVGSTRSQPRSWWQPAEAAASTAGKRSTYPPPRERSRRGPGVVVLRGYRDILTLIHPPYCEPQPPLRPAGSDSSSSSEDCPPWLPEAQPPAPADQEDQEEAVVVLGRAAARFSRRPLGAPHPADTGLPPKPAL